MSDGWRDLEPSQQFIIDFEALRRRAPPGYGFEDLDGRVVLQVRKGSTYWRFLGKRHPTFRDHRITSDMAWFFKYRNGAEEELPHVIDEIRELARAPQGASLSGTSPTSGRP